MLEIDVRAFELAPSSVINEVEGGASFVVTKRGRVIAVLLPFEEVEDLALANSEAYVRMRSKARAAYAQGLAKPLDSLT